MSDARARGWGWPGAPGSAEDRAYQRDHLTTVTLNCGVRLRVRKEVAPLFKGFFDELEAETGYSLADEGALDDWGFNNRDIRGRPGVKSNHAWGLAVDGNSEENPMGAPRRTNFPVEATHRLAAKWGLFWGFDYQSRPDTMHFEFLGKPGDVSKYPTSAPLARPIPITPPEPEEDDDMKLFVYHVPGVDALFATDRFTTRTLSHEAWVHETNLGNLVDFPLEFPGIVDLHRWYVGNTPDNPNKPTGPLVP